MTVSLRKRKLYYKILISSRAATISLVGQAVRLSPPAVAGVVGQLGKLRAGWQPALYDPLCKLGQAGYQAGGDCHYILRASIVPSAEYGGREEIRTPMSGAKVQLSNNN